jgi:hypothetical protein
VVFISYSHEDAAIAERLATCLRKHGLDVWIDHDLTVGKEWNPELNERLSESDVVLLLWSSSSTKHDWVKYEAAVAQSQDKVLPLVIEKGVTIPDPFAAIQALVLESPPDISESEARRLVAALQGVVQRRTTTGALVRPTEGFEPLIRFHANAFVGREPLLDDILKWSAGRESGYRLIEVSRARAKAHWQRR